MQPVADEVARDAFAKIFRHASFDQQRIQFVRIEPAVEAKRLTKLQAAKKVKLPSAKE